MQNSRSFLRKYKYISIVYMFNLYLVFQSHFFTNSIKIVKLYPKFGGEQVVTHTAQQ